MPIPAREAEGPIFHIRAVIMPLISPGKDQGTSAAEGERGPHLPPENALLAIAVSPGCPTQARSVPRPRPARNVMQAGEVVLEASAPRGRR